MKTFLTLTFPIIMVSITLKYIILKFTFPFIRIEKNKKLK